jgi:hypothetical protein
MSDHAETERVEELQSILGELLTIWDNRPGKTSVGKGRKIEPARLAVVLALASHTHRLARAAITLHEAHMDLEAMPLVRGVLEYGLTAQWMFHNEAEALTGFINEQQRQRRAAGKAMLDLGWGDPAEIAGIVEKAIGPPSTGSGPARSFQQLCDDFAPLGPQMYAVYRVLSGYTHVGYHVVDSYLAAGDKITIRVNPGESLPAVNWLWTLCAGCMWASRAADMLDRNRPYRAPLRRIAQALQTPATPDLHPKAWLRGRGASRKTRS